MSNRPGLAAIAYRVATHAGVLARLEAALSDVRRPGLAALRTRDPDDFTIALLDGFACMADVLAFHQERIANESFLRTATERRSMLELARLLGYELRPGVAASTYLAFRLDQGAGAPLRAPIAVGTRAQSLPGPGEVPQTFETVEPLEAVGEWNELRARTSRAQVIGATTTAAYVRGTATGVGIGDRILLRAATGAMTTRTVRAVGPDAAADRTQLAWDGGGPGFIAAELYVFRLRAALFGHNAPDWRAMPALVQQAYTTGLTEPTPPEVRTEWPGLTIAEIAGVATGTLHLDAAYPKLAPGSWLALASGDTTAVYTIDGATEDARSRFTLSSKTTRITSGSAAFTEPVRGTAVFAQSERLALAEAPDVSVVERVVELDRALGERPAAGRQVLVAGLLHGTLQYAVERAVIAAVTDDASGLVPRTTLAFETDLAGRYVRDTVRIHGNIAFATHGETAPLAVLGSGDAARAYQSFALRDAPVTYVPAPIPAGGTSTLVVRVDGIEWSEVPALFGHGPADRVYATRLSDDARTTVQFGDGKTGARLPTGRENVTARLRKGLGADGNLGPGRLTLLPSRPHGVKDVTNPWLAEGGQAAQTLAEARIHVPRSAITLDRIVSLRDYEDFARGFSGVGKALATTVVSGEALGVHLTVAGANGEPITSGSRLLADLVRAIARAGDRAVAVEVGSFRLARFGVRAGVTVMPAYDPDAVLARVAQALREQFSFAARELGQPVAKSEVITAIQRVAGVVMVDLDHLARDDRATIPGRPGYLPAASPPPYSDAGAARDQPAELLLIRDDAIALEVIA